MVVVFRGGSVNDVTDSSLVEMALAFKEFPAIPMGLGQSINDGTGGAIDPTRFRYRIPAEFAPFKRSASTTEQDYGTILKFTERICLARYRWIYRVYEGLVPSPPAYRADYDRTDLAVALSSDTFWYAKADAGDGYPFDADQGHLPMAVQVVSQPDIAYASGGRYTCSVEFSSVEVFDYVA